MANKSLKLHKFELDNDDWKIVHDLVFVLKVHIMYFILISNWQDVSNIKGPHSSFHKTMQALRPLSLPWTSSTMGSTHTQRNCTTLLSKGPCNWLVQRWTDTIQSLTNWQHTELLWVCNHRSLHYLKLISSSLVLHPGLKLDYFHVQEWEEKWVNVTKNLVCEEYICDKLGFTTITWWSCDHGIYHMSHHMTCHMTYKARISHVIHHMTRHVTMWVLMWPVLCSTTHVTYHLTKSRSGISNQLPEPSRIF